MRLPPGLCPGPRLGSHSAQTPSGKRLSYTPRLTTLLKNRSCATARSSGFLQFSYSRRYPVCRWWSRIDLGVWGSTGSFGHEDRIEWWSRVLNCSWMWSFHLYSWSVSPQSGVPPLAVTYGSLDALRPVRVRMVDPMVEHCTVPSAIRVFCLVCYAALPGGLIAS